MAKKTFTDNLYLILTLSKRSLKIFLKDKATVFFSLLAPLIILVLYVLFLGDVQLDSVKSSLRGLSFDDKMVKIFVDSWMLAGVLSVSCITVSLSANTTMVEDKQKGILNDSKAAPISKWVTNISYYVCNVVITFVICTIVLFICLLYLALTGSFIFSFGEVLMIFLINIISILSASVITVFICNYIKTVSTLSAIGGINSAFIGFIMGSYMPMSVMPKAVQYFSGLLPASYSAGLFRNAFMNGSLNELTKNSPIEVKEALKEAYCFEIDFFGAKVGTNVMYIVVIASIFVFIGLSLIILRKKKIIKK